MIYPSVEKLRQEAHERECAKDGHKPCEYCRDIECDHTCSGNCRRNGCNCECGEWHKEPCGMCGGTGEIATMERVYAGEPHMADVGSEPCPNCKRSPDEDEYDGQYHG
jgi:hypothetical protein